MSGTNRNLNHKVVKQKQITYTQILNQTFREEYIALLEEHGVVYDEKYLLYIVQPLPGLEGVRLASPHRIACGVSIVKSLWDLIFILA
jgi:hypothetical protein